MCREVLKWSPEQLTDDPSLLRWGVAGELLMRASTLISQGSTLVYICPYHKLEFGKAREVLKHLAGEGIDVHVVFIDVNSFVAPLLRKLSWAHLAEVGYCRGVDEEVAELRKMGFTPYKIKCGEPLAKGFWSMAKNKRTHPSKHKVQTPRPPSSPSPGRFTQFTLFQVLVLAGLMIPMFLLEGVNHWQTGIFFAAALAFSFLIREGIWGHRDLLQDELVTRDDHESLWLFVFGRMVQDSEGHSKERKRLLYITASGKKYLIRILIVAMVVLYFAWMKNREAVSFRPSAFLYILIFTIMISSVFACQYWAALLVSGVVAIFATSGEWGPYPLAFATFLIALFAALTSYRQSTVEWVYAHERDFLKRGIGPSPLQSVMIVALLAVFSLWFLDKVLPDSLKSQKKASISKKWMRFVQRSLKKSASRLSTIRRSNLKSHGRVQTALHCHPHNGRVPMFYSSLLDPTRRLPSLWPVASLPKNSRLWGIWPQPVVSFQAH